MNNFFEEQLEILKIKIDNLNNFIDKRRKSTNKQFYDQKIQIMKRELRKIMISLEGSSFNFSVEEKKLFSNLLKIINNILNKWNFDEIKNSIRKLRDEIFPIFEARLELNKKRDGSFIVERIYNVNSPFDFHNDIRDIINLAKKEIFIIEPYIDEDLLEITLRGINNLINIKILSNSHNHKGKFVKVSNKFTSQHDGTFDARETDKIHDRGIFIDGIGGWVIGQSLKQGGKKPTYILRLNNPKKLETIYNKIFFNSKKIK